MTHLTLFNRKLQASVFIPFGTVGFTSRDRWVQLKLLSLNSKLSVPEKNNREIAREYGIFESMVRQSEDDSQARFHGPLPTKRSRTSLTVGRLVQWSKEPRCKKETGSKPPSSRSKPPPKNIQKDVFNALITLKKDPDRLVLSADKGNCVVVMDKQQYHDKALSLLNDRVRMLS